MSKLFQLTVKSWAIICCYACFAFLLNISEYASSRGDDNVVVNILSMALSAIIFLKLSEEQWLKGVSSSLFILSALRLILSVSMDIHLGEYMYLILLCIIGLCPVIYFSKNENDFSHKVGASIIGIALLSPVIWAVCKVSISLSHYIFLISLIGFFLSSAMETEDKNTKYASYIAVAGSCILFTGIFVDIIWSLCDKPDFSYSYYFSYDKDKYKTYSLLIDYSHYFRYVMVASWIMISWYFAYILKRSNFMLKYICYSAIIACVLRIIYQETIYISYEYYNNLLVIAYTLFFYSFYNFQKKL